MRCINFLIFLLQLELWPLSCHCRQIYKAKQSIAVSLRRDQNNSSIKETKLNSVPGRTIHLGYVYDDADDVIHIIEPPKHFQELKQQRQKQQNRQQQQQKQQQKPQQIPKSATIIKVKELPQVLVSQAAAIVTTSSPINRRRRRPVNNNELLTLETQAAQSRAGDVQPPLVNFPMEILASVRQTERILQHRQQQQRPHAAKQRIKTQQTHTVIEEQGYEKSHFKRGKEQRFGGMFASSKPAKRVRRQLNGDLHELKNDTALAAAPPQQAAFTKTPRKHSANNVEQGAKLLLRLDDLLKNATLYLPDEAEESTNVIAMTHNSGVLHEFRTRFREQGAPKKLIGEIEPTTNIKGKAQAHQRQSPQHTLAEQEIYQVLENSLNATDALMQQIMRKHHNHNNNNKNAFRCNQHSLLEADDTLQQFQSKIDCMRQQLEAVQRNRALPQLSTNLLPIPTVSSSTAAAIKAATPTLPSTAVARGHRRFGARSSYKFGSTSNTTPAPASAPTAITTMPSQIHNLVTAPARQRQRSIKKSTGQPTNSNRIDLHSTIPFKMKAARKTTTTTQLLDSRNVSAAAAALLYDDVMTNIRNMLEAKHLKLLVSNPDATSTSKASIHNTHDGVEDEEDNGEAFSIDEFIEASASSSSPAAAIQAENHFRDLSLYLSGLQQMMSRLPPLTSTPAVPLELARNARTDNNGGSTSTSTNWYLINDEGKISETPFDLQLQPSTLIFHRFPDIPNAALYLQNYSTHRSTSKSTLNQDENEFDFN